MAVHTLQASILLLCILASDPLSAAPHSPNVEKTQNQGVSKSGARVIAFRSETVDPSVALSLSALRSAASRRDGDRGKLEELEARPEQVVVQMRGGKCSDRALRDALGSGASHVLSHISPCSFVAMCDSVKTALRLEAHANVVWVGPMLPEYKTAPELSASARVSTAAASRRKNAPATDPAHAAPRVALDVMVVAPMEQRLLARWAAALSEAVAGEGGEAGGGGVSVARGAKREVVVECLAGDAGRVAHWLARKAEVLWVQEKTETRRWNFHALYTQGGATSAQGGATSDVALNASGLAMRGMDGAGEVVGLADSGIDVEHCFFKDRALAVPFDKVDASHRKIVAYFVGTGAAAGLYGDRGDSLEGHGTHIAGTLAGFPEDGGDDRAAGGYKGMAPAAKIAFVDGETQQGDEGEGEGVMKFMAIHDKVYGRLHKEGGARVQSHSWGSPDSEYGATSVAADAFLHEHPDAVLVFAAGNSGDAGAGTVGSPANAKNVLAVGGTMMGTAGAARIQAQGEALGKDADLRLDRTQVTGAPSLFSNANVLSFSARGPTPDGRLKPDVVLPGVVFSARSNARHANPRCCLNFECALQSTCPNDCSRAGVCVPPDASGGAAGGRGVCACRLGFCGRDCSIASSSADPDVCCPGAENVAGQCGASNVVKQGACDEAKLGFAQGGADPPVTPACSCFSGREGLACGDPKGDSLATVVKYGTSMAAPVAAGFLLLARQALRRGFYPTGVENTHDALSPSGALLRAMLINAAPPPPSSASVVRLKRNATAGGAHLAYKVSSCPAHPDAISPPEECASLDRSFSSFPNTVQGFGRPHAERMLSFSNTTTTDDPSSLSPFRLFLIDHPGLSTDGKASFCFHYPSPIDDGAEFILPRTLPFFAATLVWTDPPGSPAAMNALVNDLDLSVMDRCGVQVLGNEGAEGASAGVADRANSVERVQLLASGPDTLGGVKAGCEAPSREVKVTVTAHYVPIGGLQPFALAVSSGAIPCEEAPSLLRASAQEGRLVLDLYSRGGLKGVQAAHVRGALARALLVASAAVQVLSLDYADETVRVTLNVAAVIKAQGDAGDVGIPKDSVAEGEAAVLGYVRDAARNDPELQRLKLYDVDRTDTLSSSAPLPLRAPRHLLLFAATLAVSTAVGRRQLTSS